MGDADVVRPATRLARSGTLSMDMRSRCGSGCSRDDGRLCELPTLGTAAHSSRSARHGLIAVPAVYLQAINALDLDYVPTGSVDEKPISE